MLRDLPNQSEYLFSVKSIHYKRLLVRSFLFFFLMFYVGHCKIDAQRLPCHQQNKIDQFINNATGLEQNGKLKEAQKILKETIRIAKTESCGKGLLMATENLIRLSSKIGDLDVSERYFTEALEMIEQDTTNYHSDAKMDMYQALQEFYHVSKDYAKAIGYGERMLMIEKSSKRPYNRRQAYMILAKSYLSLGINEKSKSYLDLYSKINDSIVSVEKQTVKKSIRQVTAETRKSSTHTFNKTILIGLGIIFVILLGFIIFRKHNSTTSIKNNRPSKNNSIQNIVADSDKDSENTDDFNSFSKPTLGISQEMIDVILRKLTKFEESGKYLRKDINLTWLSNHLNTNTRYISEVIKIHRNKNFNSYINGLRIQYITNKLMNDPVYREYKISYLSEECGYSSTQVFVIAFKKETGVTPSHYIDRLKS
ncbi:helix-turn-helix domain-containing protein [Chryseobacterium sp. RLHN22]|uniref:helix-turn-helix domain-containing protein n=1 Tax=Chryseobacterium sp. RLHN22 TaxID=3437885 RepID=UPI003D9ACB6C